MERRSFIKTGLATSAGLGLPFAGHSTITKNIDAKTFKLKYAPHIGMFKHSAGEDPIDQIKFMADQGFSAFEDNSLSNRDISLQEKIGNYHSEICQKSERAQNAVDKKSAPQ